MKRILIFSLPHGKTWFFIKTTISKTKKKQQQQQFNFSQKKPLSLCSLHLNQNPLSSIYSLNPESIPHRLRDHHPKHRPLWFLKKYNKNIITHTTTSKPTNLETVRVSAAISAFVLCSSSTLTKKNKNKGQSNLNLKSWSKQNKFLKER